MRLTQKCDKCNKNLEVISSLDLKDISKRLRFYKCGHFNIEDITSTDISNLQFDSVDGSGKSARAYQKDGVKFIIDADFSCVIGDQMRLGKTPQALLALRNKYAERTPALIIVRAANLWQWIREYKVWTDPLPLGIYPIVGTKGFIPPGFSTYIISMDTFSRTGTCRNCGHAMSLHDDKTGRCKSKKRCHCTDPVGNGDSMVERLREIPFKLIIADEAHSFKNTDSNRSRAIVNFLKEKNTVDGERALHFKCPYCSHEWEQSQKFKIVNGAEINVHDTQSQKCTKCGAYIRAARQEDTLAKRECGVILLTGTAIKNRADEYFVPLNLVAPTLFPSLERFRRRWLMQDSKGAWSRISPYVYDQFKETISPYVLRREKEDVYTDLPPINRMFQVIEPDKDALANEYNKVLDKIDAALASRANPTFWDMQESMMALRRITGLMKAMWTADYVEASLLDSENSRIAIGVHHEDVVNILKFKLSHLGCLTLTGKDSPERKDYVMRSFETSPERILIISELAGGVGMDFHYCNNVIVLERQWSYADEEQFEFRFYNPDKSIYGERHLDVEYIIAKGTLDEWFYNLVEYKKVIQGQTIGTNWDVKTQPALFRELLEETVRNRL